MGRFHFNQDVLAGLIFFAFGAFFLWFGRSYPAGTALSMGPGYFPIWLSWIIFGMGLIMAVRGLAFVGDPIEVPQLRPLIGVIGSVLVFGLLITRFGLPITVFVLVFVAAFARPSPELKETAYLAIGLAIFAVLAFIFALGQPLPLWWDFS